MIFEKKGLLGKKDELCFIIKYFAAAPAEGEVENLFEHLDPHVKAQNWSVDNCVIVGSNWDF